MFRLPRPHSLEFDTDEVGFRLKVGDTVRITMAGHQLLKIVSLAYLLPLLGMFSGAWLAAAAIPDASDLSAVVGALSGLFCVSGLLALTGLGKAGGYLRSAQLQPGMPAQSGTD
jgi:positive regulator of sigma E activity